MKKPPPKKPAKKKPVPAKKKQPQHHHHLTAAQLKHRQQARIKSLRHQLHLARHPAAAKKPPKARKPRALALGEMVACCAAEAVGASLRLTGHEVSTEAVLALHVAAGGSQDAGVTIEAALEAAARYGLGGAHPRGFAPVDIRGLCMFRMGLVLGLELPGPHAVTVAPDGCWLSWGEHYDPAGWPDAVVEEAWAVTW